MRLASSNAWPARVPHAGSSQALGLADVKDGGVGDAAAVSRGRPGLHSMGADVSGCSCESGCGAHSAGADVSGCSCGCGCAGHVCISIAMVTDLRRCVYCARSAAAMWGEQPTTTVASRLRLPLLLPGPGPGPPFMPLMRLRLASSSALVAPDGRVITDERSPLTGAWQSRMSITCF